jgi:hypothetical protein
MSLPRDRGVVDEVAATLAGHRDAAEATLPAAAVA